MSNPYHAAKRGNPWRWVVPAGVVSAIIIYGVWQNVQAPPAKPSLSAVQTAGQTSQTPTQPSAPPAKAPTAVATASTPSKSNSNSGAYHDGTYTGSAVNVYYGMVQVAAVVKNSQLTNIKMLQYPTAHQYSAYVSNYALPRLAQEALQAQTANVNGISGATQTSRGFQASLASALLKARG